MADAHARGSGASSVAPALKLALFDAAYDSSAIYRAVLDRGGMPLIPLHKPSAEKSVGITNGLGTPICPAGLPFTFWGRDGAYLKYRCPHYAQPNRLCCLKEHRAVSRCSTSPYGQWSRSRLSRTPGGTCRCRANPHAGWPFMPSGPRSNASTAPSGTGAWRPLQMPAGSSTAALNDLFSAILHEAL